MCSSPHIYLCLSTQSCAVVALFLQLVNPAPLGPAPPKQHNTKQKENSEF